MIAGLSTEPEVRSAALRYSVPNWVAIALMVVGGFVSGQGRVWLWLAALGILLVGTVRAGSSEWLIRPGHFAERHGLLVIVALGEVIVAVGLPVVDNLTEGAGLSAQTVVALMAAGVFAVLLWWGYFDRPNPALEHRHSQVGGGVASGRFARDVYTYLHVPLIGGIILSAAALEEITLHPGDTLSGPFRWMLLAGLAGYLLAVVGAVARGFGRLALERLVATVALAAVLAAGGSVDGVVLLVAVDGVLLAMLVVEHFRVEVRHRTGEPG
jgi:low temperature requirement protein LtrA